MGKEIERKFKVLSNAYQQYAKGIFFHQGYLSNQKERVVRVRLIDKKGFITIKGVTIGASRAEYEYEIPEVDALEMLEQLCQKPTIKKNRFHVDYEGFLWEIDEFLGDNEGLVIAEIELKKEDEKFPLPPWVGEEVTGNPKYYNANLVENPFKNWK